MLTDEEIDALQAKWVESDHDFPIDLRSVIREAVRLTAERCAEICEDIYLGRDNDNGSVCAAAIRERIK